VRSGARLPDDQAEVVFSDVFVEQLEELSDTERRDVLAEVIRLCADPAGKHPLARTLTGWNTLDVLAASKRVVYRASMRAGVGLIEVLCLGPRRAEEVYATATALRDSGALTGEDATQIWEALALLDLLAERVGLDGWDYRPPAAPDGMVRAAVAARLLDEPVARLLSADEIQAAMAEGWSATGPDPDGALQAALRRARSAAHFAARAASDPREIVARRAVDRCAALMPRVGARCIRRAGHPGPHRAR